MVNELTVSNQGGAISLADAQQQLERAEALYLAGLSPSGRKSQASKLRTAARVMGGPFWYVDAERRASWHIEAEAAGLSIATANAAASAVRGVVDAAWQLGMMDTEAKARTLATSGLKAVSGITSLLYGSH